MRHFGTVNSFDNEKGRGLIEPEAGGVELGFVRSALAWDAKETPPTAGQRLSYDIGTNGESTPCASNLQMI
jgi:cold shock protein